MEMENCALLLQIECEELEELVSNETTEKPLYETKKERLTKVVPFGKAIDFVKIYCGSCYRPAIGDCLNQCVRMDQCPLSKLSSYEMHVIGVNTSHWYAETKKAKDNESNAEFLDDFMGS